MVLIVKSPVRLSFGGGGTDLPSYYDKYDGMVVSSTINKYFYSIFNRRQDDKVQIYSADLNTHEFFDSVDDFFNNSTLTVPKKILNYYFIEGGFDLILTSDVPPFAGLGGSSSLTVSLTKLCHEINKETISENELAEEAHKLRVNVLQLPAGKQDEYATSYGGFNIFTFTKTGVVRKKLALSKKQVDEFNKHVLLFHTGIRRTSSNILESMKNSNETNSKGSCVKALHKVKNIGFKIANSIEKGDYYLTGRWLHESWKYKKKFSKGVSNNFIDEVYKTALKNGAYGGKITGAGGGGFMIFIAPPNNHNNIVKNLKRLGLTKYDFKFEKDGTKVINNGR